MWMILARLSGADPAGMAAARAMENGISDGTDPGNPVTRQQLVTLLFRLPAAAVSVGCGSAAWPHMYASLALRPAE